MSIDHDVVIVGGGIAGIALAVALNNNGITKVKLLEKAEELRPLGAAIGLFPNGLAALHCISPTVHEKVLYSAIETRMHTLLDLEGNVARDRERLPTSGVKLLVWYLLQQFLYEEIKHTSIVSLKSTFTSAKQEEYGVIVEYETGGDIRRLRCRVLVCADGIWSRGRKLLGIETTPQYHGKVRISPDVFA